MPRMNLVFNLDNTSQLRDLCNALEMKEGVEAKARLEGELEELIKKIETRQKERDILRVEIDTLRELYGLGKKKLTVEKADKAEMPRMAEDRPVAMSDETISTEPLTAEEEADRLTESEIPSETPSEGTIEL